MIDFGGNYVLVSTYIHKPALEFATRKIKVSPVIDIEMTSIEEIMLHGIKQV